MSISLAVQGQSPVKHPALSASNVLERAPTSAVMETVQKVYFPSSSGLIPGQTSRAKCLPRALTSAVMETVKKVYFPSSLGLIPGQTSRAKCLMFL